MKFVIAGVGQVLDLGYIGVDSTIFDVELSIIVLRILFEYC